MPTDGRPHSRLLEFTLRLDAYGTRLLAPIWCASLRWRCCGSLLTGEWQRGLRGPAGRRVSRPPGPVAPLQLRSSDPGGGEAVLVADVP